MIKNVKLIEIELIHGTNQLIKLSINEERSRIWDFPYESQLMIPVSSVTVTTLGLFQYKIKCISWQEPITHQS